MAEDDANYSSLVFKNKAANQREEKDDQTIYSEVKSNKLTTTKPKEKLKLTTQTVETPEVPAAAARSGEEEQKVFPAVKMEAPKAETAAKGSTRVLSVGLGTLCVLLAAGIIALLVTFALVTKDQEATIKTLQDNNKNLTGEKRMLMNENELVVEAKRNLTNQNEELRKERSNLNKTLEFILTFDTFPVKTFCPNKACRPCQTGWVLFQKKCYLFYNKTPADPNHPETVWKFWNESRQFCQNQSSDLVVINNQQEQEFVGNNTKFYFDQWHGFWLGLRNISNTWVWVDGRNDTLGFWNTSSVFNSENVYGLLVPETRSLTRSWRTERLGSYQKFICERDALIWPN